MVLVYIHFRVFICSMNKTKRIILGDMHNKILDYFQNTRLGNYAQGPILNASPNLRVIASLVVIERHRLKHKRRPMGACIL